MAEEVKSKYELTDFKKMINDMVSISTSVNARRSNNIYTDADVLKIYEDGSIDGLRKISRQYFGRNGLYTRMILYFSTMPTYDFLLTPKFIKEEIDETKFLQNYNNTLFLLDKMNLAVELARIATIILVDGVYYGMVINDKNGFTFYDLPVEYCRTNYKNTNGLNILEFNLHYFDKIRSADELARALKGFPTSVRNYYKQYKENPGQFSNWMVVPNDDGVAFYYKSLYPFFISLIPALIDLKDYKGIEKRRDEQELAKILIQKIPLDENNELTFELPEIQEIHRGIVEMLKDTPSVDVITTFCEAKIESLQDGRQTVRDNLEKVERSIYNEAGVSKNLFASDSSTALEASIANDFSIMWDMIKMFSTWINFYVSKKFQSKEEYFFEVNILPISHYNRKEVLDQYLQAAQNGFSKILVAIASGIKQSQLMNVIRLENDILNLDEILKPLQTSNTLSANDNESTGNTKDLKNKSDKTIKNIDAK